MTGTIPAIWCDRIRGKMNASKGDDCRVNHPFSRMAGKTFPDNGLGRDRVVGTRPLSGLTGGRPGRCGPATAGACSRHAGTLRRRSTSAATGCYWRAVPAGPAGVLPAYLWTVPTGATPAGSLVPARIPSPRRRAPSGPGPSNPRPSECRASSARCRCVVPYRARSALSAPSFYASYRACLLPRRRRAPPTAPWRASSSTPRDARSPMRACGSLTARAVRPAAS